MTTENERVKQSPAQCGCNEMPHPEKCLCGHDWHCPHCEAVCQGEEREDICSYCEDEMCDGDCEEGA